MLSYFDLPTEIRQRIIAFNFPDTCGIGSRFPRQIRAPLHTSHSLRLDTAEAIKAWSPVHYVSHPDQLKRLEPPSVVIHGHISRPRIRCICIDLFHDSLYDRITWTCYCEAHDAKYSHHELVAEWALAVKHMPIEDIQEVYIDITPAPGSSRPKARTGIVTRPFLYDKRVEKFLGCHSQDVGALLAAMHTHYQGRMELKLTGSLTAKSAWYLSSLERHSGLALQYDGKLFTGHEPEFQKIHEVVDLIVTKKQVNEAKMKRETHSLAWVRQIQWSKDTKWTYAKVMEVGDEGGATVDVRVLVEFKMDDKRKLLQFAPASGYRHDFLHRAAKTIGGLKTEVRGTGSEGHVVVKKS